MRIKKDDMVKVITGVDKGKVGKVLRVLPKEDKVVVQGVNIKTKHQKQTRTAPSEIRHMEAPIHVSNVMYYNESTKEATRLGARIEDGRKVRVAKKGDSVID